MPEPSSADADAAVVEQRDGDLAAATGERLVDRVVDDLPHEVVEATRSGRPDVHAGTPADRLEPLEHGDGARVVPAVGARPGVPGPPGAWVAADNREPLVTVRGGGPSGRSGRPVGQAGTSGTAGSRSRSLPVRPRRERASSALWMARRAFRGVGSGERVPRSGAEPLSPRGAGADRSLRPSSTGAVSGRQRDARSRSWATPTAAAGPGDAPRRALRVDHGPGRIGPQPERPHQRVADVVADGGHLAETRVASQRSAASSDDPGRARS
jgi:hypothetical protein